MRHFPIDAAVSALRFIFWGGLLCLFDFSFSQTSNGNGFKFDIISDAVGSVMIAWGIAQLRGLLPATRYVNVMNFVQIIAWMCIADAVADHWVTKTPVIPPMVSSIFSLFCLVAIVAFCLAMRWLCESLTLFHSARSWRTTTLLFLFIYLLPLGLFQVAAIMSALSGQKFHLNLGPAGLLLLLIFVVPVIHLFMSTSRMKEELEGMRFWPQP